MTIARAAKNGSFIGALLPAGIGIRHRGWRKFKGRGERSGDERQECRSASWPYPALTFAESAAPTPQCHDGDEATIRQTEGPYFKPSSPQRADLVEPETKARLVEINGQVLTRSCRPVERALVDLWHADERGEYDNAGFRYRGHLFTDGEGRYRFRTILPALYPGRTRHYHIKVQAPERPVLTTQLYFPDEPTNRRDRPKSWFQIPFQWRHLLPMTA